MTTGTKVVDNFSYIVGWGQLDCGSSTITFLPDQRVGVKTERTWGGGDTPTSSKVPRTLISYSYGVYDAKGKFLGTRKRTFWDPPKQKKYSSSLQENNYHSVINITRDSMFTIKEYCSWPTPHFREGWQSTSGAVNNGTSVNDVWNANDTISFYGKFAQAVNGDAFNMAVFLGEGKQSLQTITVAAVRIRKALHHLRNGRFSKAADSLVDRKTKIKGKNLRPHEVTSEWMSARWLELQYGWMPLVKDTFSAARHLAFALNRPHTKTYRIRQSKRDNNAKSPAPSVYKIVGSTAISCSSKALVTQLNEAALLGLTDPASLLWEKLPWSFVADWFIPVGNYLEAANLQRALTAVYVTSSKSRRTCYQSSPSDQNAPYQQYLAYFVREEIITDRIVSTSLNVPLPEFRGLDQVASFKHAVTAVSLLVQRFFGSKAN